MGLGISMDKYILQLKNLDKFYGQTQALKDINLNVKSGEVVVQVKYYFQILSFHCQISLDKCSHKNRRYKHSYLQTFFLLDVALFRKMSILLLIYHPFLTPAIIFFP